MRRLHFAGAAALLLGALALAGCGDTAARSCLPALSPPPGSCPSSTYADATDTDPVCLDDVTGSPICRGGNDAVCYVCTGADFTDGCLVSGSGMTIECVHACDKC